MSRYHQQITCPPADIDLDFWRRPQGVQVPGDDLGFLLVPDAVEALALTDLAQKVHAYQAAPPDGHPITAAVMATMGGMLPGILLYDHLIHGRAEGDGRIAFGTVGVSLYKGPNERYDEPLVQDPPNINIEGETVLVIDDLGDRGGTMAFMKDYLLGQGARHVLTLAVYMKPQAMRACPADFHFGEVDQDLWIITPRELVETLRKRVPVWMEGGADLGECRRRLVEVIGYPANLVDSYLPKIQRLAG